MCDCDDVLFLRQTNASLLSRIQELESEIKSLKGKSSKNSSQPPSLDQKPRKEKKDRGGAKPGHQAHQRELCPADEVVRRISSCCPSCGSDQIRNRSRVLTNLQMKKTQRRKDTKMKEKGLPIQKYIGIKSRRHMVIFLSMFIFGLAEGIMRKRIPFSLRLCAFAFFSFASL